MERGARGTAGFSLVEVTVAIGIFAFVAVGILGLLPAGLKQRADSSLETRAVLVAEELLTAVKAAPSIETVLVRRGSQDYADESPLINLKKEKILLGYMSQSSVPFFAWWPGSDGAQFKNPEKTWRDGEADSATLGYDLIALLHATNTTTPNLYRVSVEVRSASLPLTNASTVNFSTLVYSP
jgi:type II secretory pathway pseudopilin PulG